TLGGVVGVVLVAFNAFAVALAEEASEQAVVGKRLAWIAATAALAQQVARKLYIVDQSFLDEFESKHRHRGVVGIFIWRELPDEGVSFMKRSCYVENL
uniref:hypothetical protein n=1 Tax=Pseudomonas sp. MWU16-30323 TaxID=2878094 RepID=UPI001CF97FC6